MSNNVFTGGNEPGGLTTDYEIRMLICWLLHNIGEPVTMNNLNNAMLAHGLVNYFELASQTSGLILSGHILDNEKNQKGETLLNITAKGIKTAETFQKNIPLNVREKSLSSLRAALKMEKSTEENKTAIEETDGGFKLTVEIADYTTNLLEMSFYLPTRELAENAAIIS
ncbi:MAG: DUF4364 family protein [Oscillospiraceae bacterium]